MKKEAEVLQKELTYRKDNGAVCYGEAKREAVFAYAEKYKSYLNASKTEREAVSNAIRLAEACGFLPYTFGQALKAGDKRYYNNRGKALYLFVIGEEPLENGVRIAASHVDAPRLDLKQLPLYEDSELAYLKTHYYGGVRKFQWTALPLALHGRVVLRDGTFADVEIGEREDDPVFCITDLLPHLAKDQGQKTLNEAHTGEGMNILIGSEPYGAEACDGAVKLTVLNLLHEKYGIVEEDFLSAELEVVPALKTRDIGLDRAMLGGYAHDDRSCVFTSLTALLDSNPKHTSFCLLADKEETGSDGNTGMQSRAFMDLLEDIAHTFGANANLVRANAKCLSADVTAAFDPNYPEVFEKRNSALLHHGVCVMKYSGSRGKYSTSDASAEMMGFVCDCFRDQDVVWQTGELGKVDAGGGGTVAMYLANHNIDVIDIGLPVLSLHAPFEIISKYDLYAAYRAFCALYR